MKYLMLMMVLFSAADTFAARAQLSANRKGLDTGNGVCAYCMGGGANCVWDLNRADLGCNSPCTYESFPCAGNKNFDNVRAGVPGMDAKRSLGIMPTVTAVQPAGVVGAKVGGNISTVAAPAKVAPAAAVGVSTNKSNFGSAVAAPRAGN